MKKITIGIIAIIILVFIPQYTIAINLDNETKETYLDETIKNNEKGERKTNSFCRIRAYVHGYCDTQPELGFGFIRKGYIKGDLGFCRVSGRNGTDYFSEGEFDLIFEYLFGFTLFEFNEWNSKGYVIGFAIKCSYNVN
jgi:hypothetical protein